MTINAVDNDCRLAEADLASPRRKLRIAIASSGLGHVSRGIESWAADTAQALRRVGDDVALFQGAPTGQETDSWRHVVPCRHRDDPAARRLVDTLRPLGGWRFGCGSGYDVEQTTFALALWRQIRADFDILHVQDPRIAVILDRLHRLGLSRPRVILAHGTEEPAAFLQKLSYLQHLAPNYLDDWQPNQPARQKAFAIPNFVDTERFRPGDRGEAREVWGLPRHVLVVLSVAAIKKTHKRIDSLIREFALFRRSVSQPTVLVIAGAREHETDELIQIGKRTLGSAVYFLPDVKREEMPCLYQAADVFALASLQEMMPIAVLEALASGLPVACNDTPTLQWMVGNAGLTSDIGWTGALAAQLMEISVPGECAKYGHNARERAVELFSEGSVVSQMRNMYRNVMPMR
jgi:1,2-diacylglycerol 3-alpha-glucosyltransferase